MGGGRGPRRPPCCIVGALRKSRVAEFGLARKFNDHFRVKDKFAYIKMGRPNARIAVSPVACMENDLVSKKRYVQRLLNSDRRQIGPATYMNGEDCGIPLVVRKSCSSPSIAPR